MNPIGRCVIVMFLALAACAERSATETPLSGERLVCWEGTTAEASCGGTSLAIYLRGEEVRRAEFEVEMSTRFMRREYEFENGEPRTVVEKIWATLDERAERLEEPRLLSTKRHELGAEGSDLRREEFIAHAKELVGEFRKRRKEFVRKGR